MDGDIQDVNRHKYDIKEFILGDASGAKAEENIPMSSTGKDKQINITSLADLKVSFSGFLLINNLVKEESPGGLQQEA